MNKYIWILITLFFLVSCASDQQAETTRTPSPIRTTPTATTQPAQEPSLTPTIMPVSTPVQTTLPASSIAPSPTPFICTFLEGRTESGSFDSSLMGEHIDYLVHLPPCYDQFADRAFPALYMFHGWPLDERHWLNMGIHFWADDYMSRSITGPFIIVMPGVGSEGLFVNSSGGTNSFEGMVVNELIPHIDASYRTWRAAEARAVGGVSRGGVWALEIALRHQDLFSIVGGHSPALSLNRPLPQYDPFRLVADGQVSLRFYLDAGDRDWARAGTISFRDLLVELDLPVVYQVHEGGHVDDLWRSGIGDYLLFYADTWPKSYHDLPIWSNDVS